jgi:16S rRNA (cytidine1402-2'-O)-methyltransferase
VEADMVRTGYTQIFIETPYRNLSLLETLLANLAETTLLCLAIDLTGPNEYIKTQTVKRWKTAGLIHFGKKPAIFLIGAG